MNKYIRNICTCENGSPAVGEKCAKDLDINCDSCKYGYELVKKTDTISVCVYNDKLVGIFTDSLKLALSFYSQ